MKDAVVIIRRVCFGLRIMSYVCGFAGAIMMLAARGMTEPGRSVWGPRAFLFLTVMFCGFIACYILAFVTNALHRRGS